MLVRLVCAVLLNLVMPGSGLILAQRHWLGFTLAILFAICSHIAVFGLLIAPEAVPQTAKALAVGGAAAIWLNAQYLLLRRISVLGDRTRADQLALCHQLAEQGLEEQRTDDARGALDVALTIDDENLHTHVLRARLHESLGRPQEARQAWHTVQQLDKLQVYEQEMTQALQKLPQKQSPRPQQGDRSP